MEKRISLESRGKEPAQVSELNLDNVRTVGEFEGLTDEFVNLESLSVVKAGLTSFKGFPKLSKLKKLDVSENRISTGLNHLRDCTSLTHLCLSSNKFKDFTVLEPLKSLENLKHLEVANNPLSDTEECRSRIFSLLPSLELLDNQDQEGNEVSEDEDEEEDGVPNGGANHASGDPAEDEVEDGDDEEDLDDEEDEDESEEEDGPGLADLYNNTDLQDEDDGDYDEGEEDVEEDDIEEEEEDDEVESTRGKKRKHEEDGAE